MIKKKNVLVFPGGTEIGQEIWHSLKDCKEITLYSAGSAVSNHAPYVFKRHFIVPDVHTNNWIERLNEIIDECNINYIFPAHDDVVLALAQNASKIHAEIISSPLATCVICRSKNKTYDTFNGLLPIPRRFNSISEIDSFPVFVKPDMGQGSQGAHKVDNLEYLKGLIKNNPNLIIMEYLPGKEYTVDCFTDRRKGLLFCSGRERIRVKSGISMNSKPSDEKLQNIFRKYAEAISQKLVFYGAWFFQLKLDNANVLKLLEIAPRIGGAMATHRTLGVNFPLLSLYEKEGVDIEIMTNTYEVELDRALINRYKHNIEYRKVYVDLDDTLIIDNEINTDLIKFLYQAINKGCKIILISKSEKNVENTLKKWRIDNLFDKVILLKRNEHKHDFIEPDGAIFIDDSFSERREVFKKHKIPTFDCSMIELLFDDRR